MEKIVVTIPAYNEEKSIGYVVKEIKEVFKSLKDRIDLAIKEIKKDFKL